MASDWGWQARQHGSERQRKWVASIRVFCLETTRNITTNQHPPAPRAYSTYCSRFGPPHLISSCTGIDSTTDQVSPAASISALRLQCEEEEEGTNKKKTPKKTAMRKVSQTKPSRFQLWPLSCVMTTTRIAPCRPTHRSREECNKCTPSYSTTAALVQTSPAAPPICKAVTMPVAPAYCSRPENELLVDSRSYIYNCLSGFIQYDSNTRNAG